MLGGGEPSAREESKITLSLRRSDSWGRSLGDQEQTDVDHC